MSITATEAKSRVATYSTSTRDGDYRFDGLSDGTYRVDFKLLGFDLCRSNNVRVNRGTTAKADAFMWITGICECVALAQPLRERAGRVVDASGRPLAHARLEIASPRGRVAAVADSEGRFSVRAPVDGTWPLTASDNGFNAVTQEVSGTVDAPLVFALPSADSADHPYSERFSRGCSCPDLFVH